MMTDYELDLCYHHLMYKKTNDDKFYKKYLKCKILIDNDLNSGKYTDFVSYYYYMKYNNYYAPSLLHLCVTDYCQLKCKHCYFGAYNRYNELNLENIKCIIEKYFQIQNSFYNIGYIRNKWNTCNISGGEPLLHSYIKNIIALVCKYDFEKIKILSNGLIFSEEIIKNLDERFIYQISLDGLQKNHDYIRGIGTFDKIINNIKQIKKSNPNLYLQIAFNANDKNLYDIIELTKLVKDLGCNKIFFDRYVSYWNSGIKELTTEQFIEFNKLINLSYEKYNNDNFLVFRNRSLQYDNNYSCMASIENQVCLSSGKRIICSRYHIQNGDFLNDNIEYLVKNAIIYSIKTQLIPEECYKCENVSHCRGGMRCLSFLNNKNELSKDINCIN